MSSLRLILGDQLSESISSLNDYNADKDVILLCEIWSEATNVKHHKKRLHLSFQLCDILPKYFRTKGLMLNIAN